MSMTGASEGREEAGRSLWNWVGCLPVYCLEIVQAASSPTGAIIHWQGQARSDQRNHPEHCGVDQSGTERRSFSSPSLARHMVTGSREIEPAVEANRHSLSTSVSRSPTTRCTRDSPRRLIENVKWALTQTAYNRSRN